MKRAHLVTAAVASVVIAGAGGAFAASRLDSPNARSQAIINDAAGQLNVDPSKLSSALKKAIDNQIDAEVKAGTITADQGAALKKRVDAGEVPLVGGLGGQKGFGHGGFGRHGGGFFGASSTLATYLGITQAELRTELQSGKTLAQIAVAHNKTADGVVSTLLADAKKRLDAAVTAGRLTAAKEQTLLDNTKAMLTDLVNGKKPTPPAGATPGSGAAPNGFGFRGPGGFRGFRVHPQQPNAPTSAEHVTTL